MALRVVNLVLILSFFQLTASEVFSQIAKPGSKSPSPTNSNSSSGPKKFSGKSMIVMDSDGTLSVDYEKIWDFKAGEVWKSPITPGEHIITFTDGASTWKKTVENASGKQLIVETKLKSNSSGTSSQTLVQGKGSFKFDRETIDYGRIFQGADGKRQFRFTNVGTEPLLISKAKASCGCTTPFYPKNAIAPGESGTIEVHYDTKRIGRFNKSITLTSNADKEVVLLKITGEVVVK